MFHISSNKRAIESAIQVRDGLERLMGKQPFNSISVSSLCIEAGVSRPTFYRMFDTPCDVLHWYCDVQSKELCRSFLENKQEAEVSPFRFNINYILHHPESIELAYRANRIDIADAAFYRNIAPIIKNLPQNQNLSEDDMNISGMIMSAIVTTAIRWWIENGKKEDADQFYEHIIQNIHKI